MSSHELRNIVILCMYSLDLPRLVISRLLHLFDGGERREEQEVVDGFADLAVLGAVDGNLVLAVEEGGMTAVMGKFSG